MPLFLPGPGPWNAHNPERGDPESVAGAVEAIVPLGTAAAVSTATLALTAPTTVEFSNAYSAMIVADTPAMYWRLGASGITDQSGNGRNGTAQGGVTIGGQTGPLTATTNQASDFDGSDDHVTSSYATSDGARTFEVWVNRDTDATVDTIFGGASGGQFGLLTTDAFCNWNTFVSWGGTPVATGGWHHVAWVVDTAADTVAFYLDGVLNSSQAFPDAIAGNGNWQVGAATGAANAYDGKLAEAAIYERALSAADLLRHYNAGISPPRAVAQSSASLTLTTPARLIFGRPYAPIITAATPSLYWRLGTNGAVDQSGNARDGAGQGGITIGGVSGAIAGDADTATDFDGSNDWLYVTYAPYVNGTVRTFEFWAKRDVAGDNAVFGVGNAYCRLLFKSGGLELWTDIFGTQTSWSFTQTLSVWRHYAVIFDDPGDTASLYVDGALVATNVYTGVWAATAGFFIVGSYDGLAQFFDGQLDEFVVYERALTPLEVWDHYNTGLLPPCSAQSSGTLTIFTPQVVPLATAAAVSTATLALTAQTTIPLATSAAVSTATLALSAKTTITLATSAAVSTGTLALTAPTYITLATSAAVSTGTLTLTAPAKLTLATAAAVSTATLTLTAPAILVLSTAAAVSTGTLALTAQTKIVLATSAAVSTATLALTAQTYITLGTAAAQSAATLNLAQYVPLQTAAAVSSASLALTAKTTIVLQTAAAVSTATLSLTAQTYITLSNAVAVSTTSLAVFIPGSSVVPLSIAAATSTATLTLVAQTYITLVTAAGLSTATLDVTAPSVGGGGVGLEMPVLLLMLDDDD